MGKLIVGCGYLGRRVAERWLAAGHRVTAVTRSREPVDGLRQLGVEPIVADVTRPKTLEGLPPAETVLFAVAYDPAGGASRREVQVEGLRALLDALPREPERFLLISSTGVYGWTDGREVDEDSPCRPRRESARVLLAAESTLAEHAIGRRAVVLRMAGLYGPGRIPRKADLLAGRPIAAPREGYMNLIHVDDAADVVLAAEARATPPRTYLVSDGHPVGRRAYYTELAGLLGSPPPTFVDPPAEAPAARRAQADKRINNARMLTELGVRLRYPTCHAGLAAILADDAAGP